MGFKLAEGNGLGEWWDSKELWKSVEKTKTEGRRQRRDAEKSRRSEDPHLSRRAKDGPTAYIVWATCVAPICHFSLARTRPASPLRIGR